MLRFRWLLLWLLLAEHATSQESSDSDLTPDESEGDDFEGRQDVVLNINIRSSNRNTNINRNPPQSGPKYRMIDFEQNVANNDLIYVEPEDHLRRIFSSRIMGEALERDLGTSSSSKESERDLRKNKGRPNGALNVASKREPANRKIPGVAPIHFTEPPPQILDREEEEEKVMPAVSVKKRKKSVKSSDKKANEDTFGFEVLTTDQMKQIFEAMGSEGSVTIVKEETNSTETRSSPYLEKLFAELAVKITDEKKIKNQKQADKVLLDHKPENPASLKTIPRILPIWSYIPGPNLRRLPLPTKESARPDTRELFGSPSSSNFRRSSKMAARQPRTPLVL